MARNKDIMELVDTGKVSIAGTYSGNGIAIAAVSATLDYLTSENVYAEMNKKAEYLRNELNMLWKKSNIPAYVTGIGTMFQTWFSDRRITNYREAVKYADSNKFNVWWREMLYHGILFHPHYFENLFVSSVHTYEDIEKTLCEAEYAISEVEKKFA